MMTGYHTLEQAQERGVAPWSEQTVNLGAVRVFRDLYPVTIGHRLFVPAVNNTDSIMDCVRYAIAYGQTLVQNGGCDGFNIGMNWGAAAGQTVMYPHVHCIPRRTGDCEDPIGGIRGVVPGQANYQSKQYRNPYDT